MAKIVVIQSEEAGQRLDNFIFKQLKGVPKVRVYRAIRSGEVRVNKGRTCPEYRVQWQDKIRVPPLTLPGSFTAAPPRTEVKQALLQRIVYEEGGLIVIDKPPGMPVHGGSGIQGGVIELLRLIRPELRFVELIHRLDRETSGCLLLATRRKTLLEWHGYLTQRRAHKQYFALVKGEWHGGARRVDASLLKNVLSSGERIVKVCEEGKPAVTHFYPLKISKNYSLVEARPETGRTHQIRVHLQYIGYPIAADLKYGDENFNRELKRLGLKRLFLHAASIYCSDFGLCIPLAADLQDFLRTCSKSFK